MASTARTCASPSRPGSTTCTTPIDRNQHFIDEGARALAAARARTTRSQGPPRWKLAPPSQRGRHARRAVCHRVSRDEPRRQAVARGDVDGADRAFRASGIRGAAAVGQRRGASAQRAARARRDQRHRAAAADAAGARVACPRSAEVVVGVDTGLTHLAAALGTPTVAIFTTTDATLAGVAAAGPHAVDIGGNGRVPSLGRRDRDHRPRAARRAAMLMRALYDALWWIGAAVAAAAPVVAWPARARLSRERSASASGSTRAGRPAGARRRLDPRRLAWRDARRRAARRAHPAGDARRDRSCSRT